MKLFVIGPCRICARDGIGRIEGRESGDHSTDMCVVHVIDAVERGEECFIGARSIKAAQKEGEKRQALRQRYGWSG